MIQTFIFKSLENEVLRIRIYEKKIQNSIHHNKGVIIFYV